MEPQRRKSIRLPASVYATEGMVFSITIGTRPRAPIFENLEFGSACIAVLRGLRTATGASVHAYCLMPDHVHLLVGASERISVVAFVQRWKSLCFLRNPVRAGMVDDFHDYPLCGSLEWEL